jgi:hypothetical protein
MQEDDMTFYRVPDPVRDKIDEIMDRFDFDRVHKAMVALNWKWVGAGTSEVPSKYDLKRQARRLLNGAYETMCQEDSDGRGYLATGGFVATFELNKNARPRENMNVTVELRFVVESQDAEY